MMKQKILSVFAITLLFAVAIPAMAQGPGPSRNQGPRKPMNAVATTTDRAMPLRALKASSTDRLKEIRDRVVERKASTTERRIEMQQGLAKRKAEHTARILSATVERLEKILARVESRIAKVESEGRVVSESKAFVVEAKAHLNEAKATIALFASLDLSGDKAQENFEAVREVAKDAKENIREAHRSLMNAIRSLKGLGSNRNATTTNATSTNQ